MYIYMLYYVRYNFLLYVLYVDIHISCHISNVIGPISRVFFSMATQVPQNPEVYRQVWIKTLPW